MAEPQPITLDNLSRLSVDEVGRLFWDNQEVVTTMALPWWVNFSIVVTAAGTAIGGLATLYIALKPWLDTKPMARLAAKLRDVVG